MYRFVFRVEETYLVLNVLKHYCKGCASLFRSRHAWYIETYGHRPIPKADWLRGRHDIADETCSWELVESNLLESVDQPLQRYAWMHKEVRNERDFARYKGWHASPTRFSFFGLATIYTCRFATYRWLTHVGLNMQHIQFCIIFRVPTGIPLDRFGKEVPFADYVLRPLLVWLDISFRDPRWSTFEHPWLNIPEGPGDGAHMCQDISVGMILTCVLDKILVRQIPDMPTIHVGGSVKRGTRDTFYKALEDIEAQMRTNSWKRGDPLTYKTKWPITTKACLEKMVASGRLPL